MLNKVILIGRLTREADLFQVRNYDNNEGKRVYITEIVADNVRFLEGSKGQKNSDPFVDDGKPVEISDDDLPF